RASIATLFPYTTLFRSDAGIRGRAAGGARGAFSSQEHGPHRAALGGTSNGHAADGRGSGRIACRHGAPYAVSARRSEEFPGRTADRKSTRLNSSHLGIS